MIAIIGCGNLGEAIARGLIAAGRAPADIVASHPRAERRDALARALSIRVEADNAAAARAGSIVILAVKPQVLPDALPGLADAVRGKLVVSLAAGTPMATIESALPGSRVVRAMPNTAAAVRESATGLLAGNGVGAEDRAAIEAIFRAIGHPVWLAREAQMHALTAVSACGPAFLYAIADALADGGVAAGLTRDLAATLAARTMLGAGKMLSQPGAHPGALKDAVASAGGTTIHGLAALEQSGVRGGVIAAVVAAAERSREMAEAKAAPSSKAIAKGRVAGSNRKAKAKK